MSDAVTETDAEALAARRSDRELFWCGVAAFAISRLYLLIFFQPQMSDVGLYFEKAVHEVDLGQAMYRDVELGYPPAAWWLMLAPRLIDPEPWTPETSERVFRGYLVRFRAQMFVLDVASLCLMIGAIRRRRPKMTALAVWAWTLVTLTLAHVLYDKTDMGVWFCVTLWAYAWSRRESDTSSQGAFDAWTALALAAIGLGVAMKLVTAVMAPFVLIGVWHSRRRWSDVAAGAAVLGLAAGLPFAYYLPTAGTKVFFFLERHGGRSIQLESVYATAMMLLRPFGVEMKPLYAINAWHLDSPLTPLVRALAAVCTFGGAILAVVWAWWRRERFDGRMTYCAAGLALAGLLCVAHVLSPQYFVWGLGALLLVGVELNDSRRYLVLSGVALLVAALTTLVFPYLLDERFLYGGGVFEQPYNLVRAFHWLPSAALILRNALFVGLVVWTARQLLRPAFSAPGRPAFSVPKKPAL